MRQGKKPKPINPLLPIGRAMIHRKTGAIMGPIAPIYQEDWPFVPVPDSEILWRYMNLEKFEHLLKHSALYFARPDTFVDPFEGRLSTGNVMRMSASEEAFRALYKIAPTNDARDADTQRNVVFISCWHRNGRESWKMWSAYTSSPASVVIVTSGKALRRFLPDHLMKFGVKYAPLDNPRTVFSHNSLFYYKPSGYSFEREYRLLRSPMPGESFYSEKPEDRFRLVPITLKKIVRRVITHPFASRETKIQVEQLLRDYLPSRKREDSAL